MRVGIVGAGAAGLAAGLRLGAMGHEVVMLEESDTCGGRVATRRLHGCVVDHGAQYLRLPVDFSDLRHLVFEDLPVDGLVDIKKPVWTFDGKNVIGAGDAAQNAEPQWTYTGGLDVLGERLAAGLDVRFNHRVTSIRQVAGGYSLLDEGGHVLLEADRVLLTCPAPGAVALLRAGRSEIENERYASASHELEKVTYRPILSIVLAYAMPRAIFAGGTADDPRPYYALINTDRRHPISWLACENDKGAERVPAGTFVLVLQMAGGWSGEHFDDATEPLVDEAAALASRLLRVDMKTPMWHDVTRWRYALPNTTCDFAALNRDHRGLLCAGDYVAGGRIHLALQAGLDAAKLAAE